MSPQAEPITADFAGEVDEQSLPDELRALASDAKALAEAELAFHKTRAAYAGKQIAIIAGFGTAAAVFVFFALMALVVGTVIALGDAIGEWAAMGVVTVVLLILAALWGIAAKRRWTQMTATLSEK